mgnify:CR=1 FL=1
MLVKNLSDEKIEEYKKLSLEEKSKKQISRHAAFSIFSGTRNEKPSSDSPVILISR